MGRASPRQLVAAERRREERREITLQRLPEWGERGMPPLCWESGSPLAALRRLEDEGLARRLPEPDSFDQPRFVITEAGLAERGRPR